MKHGTPAFRVRYLEPSAAQPHREATLLYQQKVMALIQVAREYAHAPLDEEREAALLRVAMAFAENS